MIEVSDKAKYRQWLHVVKEQFKAISLSEKKTLSDQKYIYIDAMWSLIDVIFPRLMFAKGMQSKNGGYSINLLTQLSRKDNNLDALSKSFGARIANSRDWRDVAAAWWFVTRVFLFHNTTEEIDHLTVCGADIGSFFEEHIVRFQTDLDVFSRIRCKDFKLAFGFIWGVLSVDRLFRRYRPYYYIAHETDYFAGAVTRLAMHYSARTIEVVGGYGAIVAFGNNTSVCPNVGDIRAEIISRLLKRMDDIQFDYDRWAQQYYNERFLGKGDWNVSNAYKDKRMIDRRVWEETYDVDPRKKNIVIMAHCFSDASYTVISKPIYRNYYEWLICTLEIIKDIDNVNWILKAHPSRKVYGEGDRVYDIFNEYKQYKHIRVMDDEISTASLIGIADGMVTVCGSCGLEFSVHGIPVICAGNPPYGGYGFTRDFSDESTYIDQLWHMDTIEKLSAEQVDMAKKVSYPYMLRGMMASDPLEETYLLKCRQVKDRERNDVFIDQTLSFLSGENDLKESYYYKQGEEFAVWDNGNTPGNRS